MTDLTKIEKPFGLLDAETQEALKAHGGPYEIYGTNGKWVPGKNKFWLKNFVYRVKPQPPKPREWWAVFDRMGMHIGMWNTRDLAARSTAEYDRVTIIHVREVLDE